MQLTEALATGKHLKGVEIEAYVPGGDKGGNLIDQYYFEDVLVTSLSTGAARPPPPTTWALTTRGSTTATSITRTPARSSRSPKRAGTSF